MIDSLKNLDAWFLQHWMLVMPMLFGFLAVWVLLPQARRRPISLGVTFGLAALALVFIAMLKPAGAAVETVLFFLFAGMAIGSGVCMIVQQNPVYSALWFALVILSSCGLFLLQAAQFLAAATIIVYAGAIIVTFLFVIMLAQQSGLATYDRHSREPLLGALAGFVLLGALLYTLDWTYSNPSTVPIRPIQTTYGQARDALTDDALSSYTQQGTLRPSASVSDKASTLSTPNPEDGHVSNLGRSLFGDYLWAVELAGTLLLVATIGAIAIAARRTEALR